MKVLVCLDIPEIGIELMKKEGLEVTKWNKERPMTSEELDDLTQKHDALLSTGAYNIDTSFLGKHSHLKIISQFAVGYDNIDVEAATAFKIPIANTPNAMTDATADIAFGLILATARKMCYMHKRIIEDQWKFFRPQANLGQELKNKTLGVFGLGTIGMELAKRCKGAYNMDVIYCNRSTNATAESELNAKRVDFDELLQESDVISLHCALTDETRNKFDKEAFNKMKETAIFINTSRGGVHNETDLIEALKMGRIWGAGLDVTNPEPMKKDNPLLFMENVAVTPHIGSATIDARNRMSKYAAENIIACYRGDKIPYVLNSF